MKSKVQASSSKQFEYVAEQKEGKIQIKVQPELYYLKNPWLWKPTDEERKKGKRIRLVCSHCGFEVLEMSILDKGTCRTKWWDWELRSLIKNGKWYGILDHNVNKPVEYKGKKLGGRKYLPVGCMTVSCCCGNSERDQLKLPIDRDRRIQKGFKIRFL